MNNPRFTGLLLLLTGVLVLMGNTLDALPPQAFWAGLLTYPIGGYLFFMGSRQSMGRFSPGASPAPRSERVEAPPRRAPVAPAVQPPVEPVEEPSAGSRIVESLRRPAPAPAPDSAPRPARPEPLAFPDLDENGDFDQPEAGRRVEVQQRPNVADELDKLAKLQRQGIISAEEYAVAKAKLLG